MHSQTILSVKSAAASAGVPESEIRDAMQSGGLTILTTQKGRSRTYDPMNEASEGGPFVQEYQLCEWAAKRAFGNGEGLLLEDFEALLRAAQARLRGPDGNWEGAAELIEEAGGLVQRMEIECAMDQQAAHDLLDYAIQMHRKASEYCDAVTNGRIAAR